jgi:hypothetical protein
MSARVQGHLLKGFTRLDASVLKLLAIACKHERNARALDLAMQLQLPKSLTGALKLANHYKLGSLADRIGRLMDARFEETRVSSPALCRILSHDCSLLDRFG